MPKAFFFDLDGTLTDPKIGITRCLQYALEKMKHPEPPMEELVACIGPPLHENMARLLGPARSHEVERGVLLYRERFRDVGLFENALYDGIPECLQSLRDEGHLLFLCTSKARVFAERILEHFGLAQHFERAYGSELDGTRADKGELIAYLLECEGLRPSDAVMIGDRKYDVVGASKNGVPSVGILWGYGSEEELSGAGATRLCRTPGELAVLLKAFA
jgi:phosphoglycolate phosphatase